MSRKMFVPGAFLAAVLVAALGARFVSAQEDPADTSPPTIISCSADPATLWPPNHKMKNVTLFAALADDTDPTPSFQIIGVASNEPVTGPSAGKFAPDWVITGPRMVQLRSERNGNGTGRIYTITIQATDASGNTATSTCEVKVPHDKRKK